MKLRIGDFLVSKEDIFERYEIIEIVEIDQKIFKLKPVDDVRERKLHKFTLTISEAKEHCYPLIKRDNACPYCGSNDLDWGVSSVKEEYMTQPIYCNNCGSHSVALYDLVFQDIMGKE